MATILFVSELGGGAGHVGRMLPLAQAVAAAGHRPCFLVPNPEEVATVLERLAYPLRSTPRLPVPSATRGVATSFADILGGAGFGDPDGLEEILAQWDRTLQDLAPAVVVCEFSPFLCLATRGGDVPVVVIGYGFVLPPAHLAHFPALLPGRPPLHRDDHLLNAVEEVQRRRRRRAPETLPAILEGNARFLTGLPELDPYRKDRRDPVAGPPDTGVQLANSEGSEDIFGYLFGDHPVTSRLLRALARSGLQGSVYVRGGPPGLRAEVSGSAIEWLDRPARMPEKLQRARLVVHHASMLTTEEALLAGRAQLVAPLYLEHLLTTRLLLDLDAAATVVGASDSDMLAAVQQAASNRSLGAAALAFAVAHQRPAGEAAAAALRDRVLALAGR